MTDTRAAGANIDNLLGMARTAELARNNDEAISYYNRVLEADPTVADAWLGKGRCAGWLSTLANLRTPEMLIGFQHAMANTPDDQKAAMAVRANSDAVAICSAMYSLAHKHQADFPTLDSARSVYVASAVTILDALRGVRDWNPNNRAGLELEVRAAQDLLNLGMSAESKPLIAKQLDEAASGIEAIDPDYKRPALALRTTIEAEREKAEMDNLGVIVAIIMMVLAAIVAVAARGH